MITKYKMDALLVQAIGNLPNIGGRGTLRKVECALYVCTRGSAGIGGARRGRTKAAVPHLAEVGYVHVRHLVCERLIRST